MFRLLNCQSLGHTPPRTLGAVRTWCGDRCALLRWEEKGVALFFAQRSGLLTRVSSKRQALGFHCGPSEKSIPNRVWLGNVLAYNSSFAAKSLRDGTFEMWFKGWDRYSLSLTWRRHSPFCGSTYDRRSLLFLSGACLVLLLASPYTGFQFLLPKFPSLVFPSSSLISLSQFLHYFSDVLIPFSLPIVMLPP